MVLLKHQSNFDLPKIVSFEKLSMSLHLIHFIVSVVVMLLMNVVQGWLEIPYFPVYKSTGVQVDPCKFGN